MWKIFIAAWVAIGFGLHWLNDDLPAGIWVLVYLFPMALTAISVSMAKENDAPWRCRRCGQTRAIPCEYARATVDCPTWAE